MPTSTLEQGTMIIPLTLIILDISFHSISYTDICLATGYIRHKNKACLWIGSIGEMFSKFEEAEAHCESDESCIMFYRNGDSSFRSCPIGSLETESQGYTLFKERGKYNQLEIIYVILSY